ncbi:MAG: bifunctional folylpolyglutamate synthase/dihydrofolate synthase [Clostridia bacterium]|nr:bifunctional folylpolyglutamate synthase/dihydrofolate synthase [Clostridia bacterium]
MNYSECLAYIHGVNWCFCKPGLARIDKLCELIGRPERDLKCIHVAGTNGKGSFSSMLASVLCEAGYTVGLYTSPYVKVFNEQIRVNGESIGDSELIELTEWIRPIADSMQDKPTEFELITALALAYFRQKRCDIVVLEAGMGGRLDSTNVIQEPLLSVITGVALDHTAFLGDTVEKIAAEKAGIIKTGRPVLFGGTDKTAEKVIRECAKEKGAELTLTDYSAIKELRMSLDGSRFDFGEHKDIHISLLGSYQPRNAASVLTAVDILRKAGVAVSEQAIKDGLRKAKWPARFEILCKEPLVIFDGAHNPQGIAAAVESIKLYFGDKKVYVMTGVLRDKDYTVIAKSLASVASKAFTLTPDNPRALLATEYAEVLRGAGIEAFACNSISEALEKAKNAAKADGVPLLCLGSLYVYASL